MENSTERAMFRKVCRRFTENELTPHAHEWEEAGMFPRELYRKAAAVGILGAGYPEAYGGSGGDKLFSLIAAEEMLWAGSTGIVVGLQSLGIALPSIILSVMKTRSAIDPSLPQVKIAALGVTEPGRVATSQVSRQLRFGMVTPMFSTERSYSSRVVFGLIPWWFCLHE